MTVYDDAIESVAPIQVTQVTFGGGSNPLLNGLACDVQIDRAVDDLSETVTNVAGTAAAQATVVLKGGNASGTALDLAPFSTNANSMRTVAQYGMGMSVVITETVYPTGLTGASQTYTLFTGVVDSMSLGSDSVTITCLDTAATLQGTVTLPSAAGSPANFTTGDTRLNPMAVVDLSLRSAGKYLSPAPRTGCLLSVPGIGSVLPDVGSFVTAFPGGGNQASPWPTQLPTVDYASGGTWSPLTLTTGGYLLIEGWTRGTRPPSGERYLFKYGQESQSQVAATVFPDGSMKFYLGVLGSSLSSAAGPSLPGIFPNDGAWHYVALSAPVGALSAGTANLMIDNSSLMSAVAGIPLEDSTNPMTGPITVTSGVPWLGFQAAQVTADPYPSGYNFGWAPNYSAVLNTQPVRVSGIAAQTGPAWGTIQQVAKAYGDVAWFDGAGVFRYETRSTWKARRFAAAARLLDETRIVAGEPQWSTSSVCKTVSASVQTPQVAQSTVAAPAWVATEVYTVAARSTVSFQVDLGGYQVFDIKAPQFGVSASALRTWFYPVPASSVGDPAATAIGSVTVKVAPNAAGFVVTVTNPNPVAIALWEPTTGGPYLIVHGKTIRWPEAKTITANAGALIGQDLALGDNPWRQDATTAAAWLDDIAGELGLPQVMWPSVTILADPRRSIGDVLSMDDDRLMDVTHPVQIVGTNYNLPAEGRHEVTLTVRGAYRPTGWAMDVTGRTEMDSNTLMAV